MALRDTLEQILEWHRKNNTPASRLLQKGLSEAEIASQLDGLPFSVPRELVELYRWRNGTRPEEEGEDPSLFEIHRFLPLEEAVQNYRESDGEAWLLVFEDVTGDGYAVSGKEAAAEHAPVMLVTEGEAQKVFSSLARMMEVVARAFHEGAMGWEDEELETDFFAWGELARRIDPGIPYWKDYLGGEG